MAKKILVPMDRSAGGEAALAVAADLARIQGAVIRLLHVAPIPTAVVVQGRVVAYVDQESERLRHEAEAYLHEAAQRLPSGPPVEYGVRFGSPAGEILAEAREVGADLIAMATHGRAGMPRVLLGSVAEAVLRHSEVAVMLVRHGLPATP